jgi:ABC-type transporter lipoprotein component MlaA
VEVDAATAQDAYEFTRQAYARAGAASHFRAAEAEEESTTADWYLRLLGEIS